MTRPVRVVLSVLLLAVAGVTLLLGLAQTTISYLLPDGPGRTATRHTAVYSPGVVAAVVAAVVSVIAGTFLVLNVVRRPSRSGWLVMVALVVVDLIVLGVVSNLSRPTF